MKNKMNPFLSRTIWGLALAGALPLSAADIKFSSVPNECKVRMDGTSTIHDWYAESGVIGGFIEADASFPDTSKGAVKPKVEVNIPVRMLKSSGGRKMDSVMLEHLKAADHKMIKYSVTELAPKGANAAGGVDYTATGTLTISGVTRTNTMPVTVAKTGEKIKIMGATTLKMTDYGVQPPAPDIGLGLIKTGDEIKLKFEWVTEKAQ